MKKLKKSILLSIAFIIPLLFAKKTINVSAISNPRIVKDDFLDSGQKVTWDCIYFGNYPQTEIVDKPETSGTFGKIWGEKGDYEVNPEIYKKLKKETSWDKNGDTIIEGKKYRRISRKDATYSSSSIIYNYDWKDVNNVPYHYFRYDKIKWRILNVSENKVFLLADKALDSRQYNIEDTSITWYDSTLRSWLNGYGNLANKSNCDYSNKNFIQSAFTTDESDLILKNTVKNDNNIKKNTVGGNDTKDKIFLLSESEVYTETAKNYGFVAKESIDDNARRSKSTTYAKAMGAFSSDDTGYIGYSYWWLRSPGTSTKSAACIFYDGGVVDMSVHIINAISVRPALKMDLSKLNYWTYAGTVCSDGTVKEVEKNDSQQSISTKKRSNKIYASSTKILYGTKSFYLNVKTKGKATLSYKSSNKKVATINNKGKIILKGYGKATISIYAHETAQYAKESKNITVTVIPKKVILKKVTSPKKNFVKVEWGKDKTVTGYQMIFSRTKNFKNSTYTRWYKQKQNSMNGFGLERKKIYYFKIRAYKTVGKQKIYGEWSSVKKVKIK